MASTKLTNAMAVVGSVGVLIAMETNWQAPAHTDRPAAVQTHTATDTTQTHTATDTTQQTQLPIPHNTHSYRYHTTHTATDTTQTHTATDTTQIHTATAEHRLTKILTAPHIVPLTTLSELSVCCRLRPLSRAQ